MSAYGITIPEPNLSSKDRQNFISTSIPTPNLGNPIALNFVLYGEPKWAQWRSDFLAAGLSYYAPGYAAHDGYTFFVQSSFGNLPSGGDNWGLLFDIPSRYDGSATGFRF